MLWRVRQRFRPAGARAAARWYENTDEEEKYRHILEAVNYVRIAQLPPVFFEFGCHSARTFSAALLSADQLRVELDAYAFDSFEGLPPTDPEKDGIFRTGEYATSEKQFKAIVKKRTGRSPGDDHLVKGFYEASLTPELSTSLPREVGFIHLDVDIYSSAATVLRFIEPHLITGTVILVDDWYCFAPGQGKGVSQAFEDFLGDHSDIRLVHWKNYSNFGRSFFVTRAGAAGVLDRNGGAGNR